MSLMALLTALIVSTQPTTVSSENQTELIYAKDKTTIQTPLLDVSLAPGSVVLIRNLHDAVLVRTLSEQHRHSVHVHSGEYSATVPLGEETMVAHDQQIAGSIDPDNIGRRSIKLAEHGKLWVRTAEFNMQDNLVNENVIAIVKRSDSDSQDRILNDLIKTTAIWTLVTRERSPYSRTYPKLLSARKPSE